jgi:hypothetical protein
MKPKIRIYKGVWYCSLNGVYGYGDTPVEAFIKYAYEPRKLGLLY